MSLATFQAKILRKAAALAVPATFAEMLAWFPRDFRKDGDADRMLRRLREEGAIVVVAYRLDGTPAYSVR